MHTSFRSSSWIVRALVLLALAWTVGCRGGPAPRFVLWEPAGGWLAAEESAATIEVRSTVVAPADADHRVVVEVEKLPLHQTPEVVMVPATQEGGTFRAHVPTTGLNGQTRYRWIVESASRVTAAGQPIVYAKSDKRVAMVIGTPPRGFHVVAPQNGATHVGQPIPGDPGYVNVRFQFQSDTGGFVEYILRVEDERQRVQWFDHAGLPGTTERHALLERGVTYRCVPYGVMQYPVAGLGTYRVYVRGAEMTITTMP